jgi:hypothetical protein
MTDHLVTSPAGTFSFPRTPCAETIDIGGTRLGCIGHPRWDTPARAMRVWGGTRFHWSAPTPSFPGDVAVVWATQVTETDPR